MPNVLVNGFSAKSGGGEDIFDNFISLLHEDKCKKNLYFVLTSNYLKYSKFSCENVRIINTPLFFGRPEFLLFFYTVYLFYINKKYKIEVTFNFADIILPLNKPQIYFFDWAYMVYPEGEFWNKMPIKSYIVRKVKYLLIKYFFHYADKIIAQTDVMAARLKSIHGLTDIIVIPSAVSLTREIGKFDFPMQVALNRKKLLCLSSFAPHKNVEILLPVARLIKENQLGFTIITTLNGSSDSSVKNFFLAVEQDGLQDYIVNVGVVESKNIASLLDMCDAVLLPTVLESFGLPFYEAMQAGKTIITSNIDFARDACKDSAYYFDPYDPKSIYGQILCAFQDSKEREEKIKVGRMIFESLPTWPQVYQEYINCINLFTIK